MQYIANESTGRMSALRVFGRGLASVMVVVGESFFVVVATCSRGGSEMGVTRGRPDWKAGGTKRGRRWVRRVRRGWY